MAKVATQILTISIHKLVKSKDSDELNVITDEMIEQLEEVVSSMVNEQDEKCLVEISEQ